MSQGQDGGAFRTTISRISRLPRPVSGIGGRGRNMARPSSWPCASIRGLPTGVVPLLRRSAQKRPCSRGGRPFGGSIATALGPIDLALFQPNHRHSDPACRDGTIRYACQIARKAGVFHAERVEGTSAPTGILADPIPDHVELKPSSACFRPAPVSRPKTKAAPC